MTNEQLTEVIKPMLTEVMKPMLNEIVKPMFDQMMKHMNDGFAEVKVEIKEIKTDVDGIKKSLAHLTGIVKMNHPEDFV